jgi:hypothetical protein
MDETDNVQYVDKEISPLLMICNEKVIMKHWLNTMMNKSSKMLGGTVGKWMLSAFNTISPDIHHRVNFFLPLYGNSWFLFLMLLDRTWWKCSQGI